MTQSDTRRRFKLRVSRWLVALLVTSMLLACEAALPVQPIAVATPTATPESAPAATPESVPAATAAPQATAAPAATSPADPFAAASYRPSLTAIECPFRIPVGLVEGESILCGRMRVPQDRRQPDGASVAIPYALIRSASTSPRPDPLVYLVGGPGGSALLDLPTIYSWFAELRAERDLVLFDQRGTLLAEPALDCDRDVEQIDPDAERARVERLVPEQYRPLDDSVLALPACYERLAAQGVDLTQYNSETNARDTLDLVHALGYDQFNLYGTSYGTRLALTIMRSAPPGLRAIVLDSTLPPQVNAYEELASKRYAVALSIFDRCAADAACNAAYPGIKERYFALLDRLERSALYAGDPALPPLDRDELIEFVIESIGAGAAAYIPQTIDELDRGITTTYLQIRRGELPPPEPTPTAAPQDFDYEAAARFVARFNDALNDLPDEARRAEATAAVQRLTRHDPDRQALAAIIRAYLPAEVATDLFQRLAMISDAGVETIYQLLIGPPTAQITGGANLAVECHEEVPFNDFETAMTAHHALGLPDNVAQVDLDFVRSVYAQCALWPAGRAPALDNAPVQSDLPVLMLQGLNDEITPPAWAAAARESLSRAQYVAFDAIGHDVMRNATACAAAIVRQFLDAPTAPVDPACAAQFRIQFATGARQ